MRRGARSRADRQGEPEPAVGSDPRVYYRVATRLPVRARRATPADLDAFEQRIALGGDDPWSELTPAMAAWVLHLDRKLERVLSYLDPAVPRPVDRSDVQEVVISGGGMLLPWPGEPLPPETDVLVELLLPGAPPRPVEIVASVVDVRTAPDGGPPGLALRFRLIDESDRDAIVRLVYRVQLAELRARGEARES